MASNTACDCGADQGAGGDRGIHVVGCPQYPRATGPNATSDPEEEWPADDTKPSFCPVCGTSPGTRHVEGCANQLPDGALKRQVVEKIGDRRPGNCTCDVNAPIGPAHHSECDAFRPDTGPTFLSTTRLWEIQALRDSLLSDHQGGGELDEPLIGKAIESLLTERRHLFEDRLVKNKKIADLQSRLLSSARLLKATSEGLAIKKAQITRLSNKVEEAEAKHVRDAKAVEIGMEGIQTLQEKLDAAEAHIVKLQGMNKNQKRTIDSQEKESGESEPALSKALGRVIEGLCLGPNTEAPQMAGQIMQSRAALEAIRELST